MNNIKFSKFHGCGNDFVVIGPEDTQLIKINKYKDFAVQILDRHFGIGGDGLMLINSIAGNIVNCFMLNPDGSHMGMCGNGVRCVASYSCELANVNNLTVKIFEGRDVFVTKINDNRFSVKMGQPEFTPEEIPCLFSSTSPIENFPNYFPEAKAVFALSMGNPHLIFIVNENTNELCLKYGPIFEYSKYFPKRTNVEFVQVLSQDHIKVDVWERGAGKTLACGTGACAAAIAAIRAGHCSAEVKVTLPGGDMQVFWDHDGEVVLTGEAVRIYDGVVKV